MMQENCMRVILILGMILLNLIAGCNGETDKPLSPTEETGNPEDLPSLAIEDLVGTWVVVSKNGENFEETFVKALVADMRNKFQNVEQKITLNSWAFAEDGSWTWELGAEILAGGEGGFFKLGISLLQKGRFDVSAATFSLQIDNVAVQFKPKDLLQLAGLKEIVLQEALALQVVVPAKSTWDLQENLFTLTGENGEEVVLRKQ